MAKIENAGDFRAWLQGKPREVAVVLAARVALRALPLVGTWRPKDAEDYNLKTTVILVTFRATAAPWAAAKYPAHDAVLQYAADAAAYAASAASAAYATSAASDAASAAYAYAYASAAYAASSADAASSAAASSAAASDAADAIWASIESDAGKIEAGLSPTMLADLPLWDPGGLAQSVPPIFGASWSSLKSELLAANADWDVWTDWYQARLAGRPPRSKDIELFRVTLSDEAATTTAKDGRGKDWDAILKPHVAD